MKTVYFILVFFLLSQFLVAAIINVPVDQPTIQAGINVAVNADTVLVQPGTYAENINYNGKHITVGSLFLTTQDTTYIFQTIIDGSSLDSVVKFESEENPSTVLTGLTITNGRAERGGGIYCSDSSPSLVNVTISGNRTFGDVSAGGGIYCSNSSPSLVNVTISSNFAYYNGYYGANGGGIYCWNSNPSLQNVTIINNIAYGEGEGGKGGGILCNHSSPSLENVTISGNTSNIGGGIFCFYSNPSLVNATITSNSSVWGGGGIYCSYTSSPSLVNVTISGNSSENVGGGIHCYYHSNPSLVNVTITGNSANLDGGGIYCYVNSNPSLVNCILWNDLPQEVYFYGNYDPSSVTISYSDIQGGEAGIVTNNNGTVNWLEGNLEDDPLFIGTGVYPYSLQDLSPCINVGITDTTGLNLPEFDLAGNPRVYGARIDMGAYENQNVIVSTDEDLIPLVTKLNQNYPNPFNPETTINYSLKENAKVSINIYNIKGQKVRTLIKDKLEAGDYSIIWNGKNDNNKPVSSGIYFYKHKTSKYENTKKMILLK